MSKDKWWVKLLIILGLVVISLLFYWVYRPDSFSAFNDLVRPTQPVVEKTPIYPEKAVDKQNRQVNEAKFTPSGYLVPIAEPQAGSIYGKRVQINGQVTDFNDNGLVVTVAAEQFSVSLPVSVKLRCVPEFFTEAGRQISAKTVYLDFSRDTTQPRLVTPDEINSLIAADDSRQVTMIVTVDNQDQFSLDTFVGYVC